MSPLEAETSGRLNALMEVGRLVASDRPLAEVLDGIAFHAASVVDGCSAGILHPRWHARFGWLFTVAGAWHLSDYYRSFTNHPSAKRLRAEGPQALCIQRLRAVLIEDTELDPTYRLWRTMARKEHFRASASVPLILDDEPVGALDVHRSKAGPWPEAQVDLLLSFASHAANAIRTASLLDERGRQLAAMSKLVQALREQTHEHANRIHAITGLLALDKIDEARKFASTLDAEHRQSYQSVANVVGSPILAGLLTAEILTCRQRGIEISLSKDTQLPALPPSLSDTVAVTIVGNLLQNAVDAVASLVQDRRRIQVALIQNGSRIGFHVRDWGLGIAPDQRRLVAQPGYTTKSDHPGLGLTLVSDAVIAAGGRLQIRAARPGTRVSVLFDLAAQ